MTLLDLSIGMPENIYYHFDIVIWKYGLYYSS